MPTTRTAGCAMLIGASLVARTAAGEDAPQVAEHRLELIGGIGVSLSTDSSRDGTGEGGYAEAEYVFRPNSVFTPRLYAGLLVTVPQHDSCHTATPCDVESQIGFAGAKLRVMAPIPWFGPYLELGLGLSAGNLRTLDGPIDETSSGLVFHIPVAIGVALGQRNQYDIGFSYLIHPGPKQTDGAIAFGFGFAVP
jgi:hypothetical protein